MKTKIIFNDEVTMNLDDNDFMVRIEDGQPKVTFLKKPLKTRIKHFFGWLFRYCPYGKGCPPKKAFSLESVAAGGGGC